MKASDFGVRLCNIYQCYNWNTSPTPNFLVTAQPASTFRVYMYAAEESYITLYAGTPSSSYPQRAILEFFESLKIGR